MVGEEAALLRGLDSLGERLEAERVSVQRQITANWQVVFERAFGVAPSG